MKAKGGRNLIQPQLTDLEKMGLRRSGNYELLTYKELIEKLEVEGDPLCNAATDYAKKVHDYALRELFIVPDNPPSQAHEPVYLKKIKNRSINLGSEGLLEHFSQLLSGGLNWELPPNGSVQAYLDGLRQLQSGIDFDQSENGEKLDKIKAWTNCYGLLFTDPMPESLIENIYHGRYLPWSDDIYRGIRAQYNNVPYFLGVQAFAELSLYALKLLFVTWLYHNDAEIREKAAEAQDNSIEESILQGYCLLDNERSAGLESAVSAIKGEEYAAETRASRLRQFALRELSRHMSVWIRLEMASTVKAEKREEQESESDLDERIKAIFDSGDKGLAIDAHFQCASLFGCVMLEALSSLKNKVRYQVCPECKNVFALEHGRSDRDYCSNGRQDDRNCKAKARNTRLRQKRSAAKISERQNQDNAQR